MKRILYISILSLLLCRKTTENISEAESALIKRDYTKALFILEPLKSKKNARIKYLFGKTYLGLKNVKEFTLYFNETLKLDSSYTDSIIACCIKRAKELYRVKEYETAIQILKYAEKLNGFGKSKLGLLTFGDIYKVFGEFTKAEYYYRKALTYAKPAEREKIWEKLIKIYEDSKEWDQACRVCLEAMRKDKLWHLQLKYTQYAYKLAETLFTEGKIDSAAKVMEEASKLEIPNMIKDEFFFLYGEILLAKGDIEKAKQMYKLVLSCALASPSLRERSRERLKILSK